MRRSSRWLVAALLLAGLGTAGCAGSSATSKDTEPPARVEQVPGTHLKRVVLSAAAAKTLGIRTAIARGVREPDGGHGIEIPYAAVFYDSEGDAFTYTNPSRLAYVRQAIVVDDINRHKALLQKGPAPGTAVVTVGTDELLGVEEGVQE